MFSSTGTDSKAFAGFRACNCVKDFFRTHMFKGCLPCKDGLKCSNESVNLTTGFWWKWNATRLELYQNFTENLKNVSFTPEANESLEYPYNIPQPYKCPIEEACEGGLNSSCKTGYEGPLCAVCSDGHYKQLKKCRPCPTKGWMAGQLAIVVAIFVLLAIFGIWRSKKKSKKDTGRSVVDSIFGKIKVLVGFYQVTFGIMEAFRHIKWPESLSFVGKYSEIFQINFLQIVSPHCIIPSFKVDAFGDLFAVMSLNVAAVIVALASYGLFRRLSARKILNQEERMKKIKNVREIIEKNLVFFLFVTYLNTCLKTSQVLPLTCHKICTDKDDESCEEYLKVDYAISCRGIKYNRLVYVAYCCLGYVIILPVAAFLVIWKRKRSTKKTQNERGIDEDNCDDDGTAGLRFLHESYSPNCWYWELVETFRKVTLTSGLILLGTESRAYIFVASMISAFYCMLFAAKKPIADPSENKLMLTSLVVTMVNLVIGTVSAIPEESISPAHPYIETFAFNALVVFSNCLVIGLLVGKCRT